MTGLAIPRWAIGVGVGCLVVAGAFRLMPDEKPIGVETPSTARYSGPMLEPARSGVTPVPLLRLARLNGAEAVSVPEVAAPSLVGVITAGAARMAYLKSAKSGAVERVALGGEMDGWRLVAVTAMSATLERNGERAESGMFAVGRTGR